MKIYIVTRGEYGDYSILAVFLDKAKAKAFVKKCKRFDCDDEVKIEEFEEGVPFDFETLNVYAIRFYYDGTHDIAKKELYNVYDFQRTLPSVTAPDSKFVRHKYFVTVAAKDEEHAFKIACDALAKWKAEKDGL
mgnify:CR=1 FL=1